MPTRTTIEKHVSGTETVRDFVIGMSDGLTVPFALAAGLSGATSASGIVVIAGLAEIAAGAIAMGLGGFLAARTDAQHYDAERAREEREVAELPDRERQEVEDVFTAYGVSPAQAAAAVDAICASPGRWVDFMMKFELGLEPVEPGRARVSALTIGGSYVVGGLVPLAPYMLVHEAGRALWWSVGVTLLALLVFGAVKAAFTGAPRVRGALQTALVGGLAAGAAFALAKLLQR